ncbi:MULTISPECIES: archease [Acidianus]|uniref:Protein archease n=1 Tax=Candidatus Acidianus copahuensis TaxID=1160895 RepID=A0A031LP11_9CREN|nr:MULTISPECIES: archease [Acidianus]EZQ03834.1 archease [Candidatus Acidianus copahuensis]NON63485.1 archease [Acidianus sp. RZ1]
MKKFEFVDNTADVGIRAFGNSLNEAFENAALAMFEVMTDTQKVSPKEKREINVDGIDLENLLYRWLEALLVFYDSELLLFSKFKVNINQDLMSLNATVWGEKFDSRKHEKRTLVKAITYSQMSIKKTDNEYILEFVVDI